MKYHAYIGRWQSPHKGHRWLIDQHLSKNEPVLILVRNVPIDDKNPFTAAEVRIMLYNAFAAEIARGLVAIEVIPDIASVNYGRGVGYDVVCHEAAAPPEIKRISATDIRGKIRKGDESWKELVMPGAIKFIEEKFSESSG
jgi:nicotinic acid mononucleotide adenylyltransferase